MPARAAEGGGGAGGGKSCKCGEPGVTLTPASCNWPDGEQCSGLASAYCYVPCGGWTDVSCLDACEAGFDAVTHPSGSSYAADTCTITITCP